MSSAERLNELIRLWPDLTDDQQKLLLGMANDLVRPITAWRNSDSDVISNNRVLLRFGDYLKTHHVLSNEPFRKEKFEYALQRIYSDEDIEVDLPRSRTEEVDLLDGSSV